MKPKTTRKFFVESDSYSGCFRSECRSLQDAKRAAKAARKDPCQLVTVVEVVTTEKVHKV